MMPCIVPSTYGTIAKVYSNLLSFHASRALEAVTSLVLESRHLESVVDVESFPRPVDVSDAADVMGTEVLCLLQVASSGRSKYFAA